MRSWKLEELKIAVENSFSWAEVCRNLDLSVSGGLVKSLQKHTQENGFDYSHFKGQAWRNGKKFEVRKIPLDMLLKEDVHYSTVNLKHRLWEEGILIEKCGECGLENCWNGKPIKLHLDHINGNNTDNRLENLRILCPNCHSQTDTYAGRNKKEKLVKTLKKSYVCYLCRESEVSRLNVQCRECYLKSRRKNF